MMSKKVVGRSLPTLLALLISGCASIAGTWERISIEPENLADMIPIERVTFGDDGTYAATYHENGRPVTRTGTYEWLFREIDFVTDGLTTNYPAHLRWDGKLVLNRTENLDTATLVLQRRRP